MKTPIYPGEIFGKLTAREKLPGSRINPTKWLCECECGNSTEVISGGLRNGNTQSCGCAGSRNTAGDRTRTHGMSQSKVYGVWQTMLNRCRNPKVRNYADYGGRGIRVCDRWLSFENFLADMGEPLPGQTIERTNNDEGYEQGNCIWASRLVQANNRHYVHRLTYLGLTHTLHDWSKLTGVRHRTLYWRVKSGWPVDEILCEYHPDFSEGD